MKIAAFSNFILGPTTSRKKKTEKKNWSNRKKINKASATMRSAAPQLLAMQKKSSTKMTPTTGWTNFGNVSAIVSMTATPKARSSRWRTKRAAASVSTISARRSSCFTRALTRSSWTTSLKPLQQRVWHRCWPSRSSLTSSTHLKYSRTKTRRLCYGRTSWKHHMPANPMPSREFSLSL